MTNKYAIANFGPSMNIGLGGNTSPPALSFHSPAKEVMRITAAGVWVDPDLTTDEAAKAVIAVLDKHIKFMFSKKDAAMRMALGVLHETGHHSTSEAITALEEALGT